MPAITSNSVPSSVSGGSLIALVDTRLIDIGDEDLILADSADQASLQMVTNPQTGETYRCDK